MLDIMLDEQAFRTAPSTNLELADFGGMFLTSAPLSCNGRSFPGINAYVQWFKPVNPHPLSITLVHGGGGQGSEFLTTPDGRPGWVHDFLKAGFSVFVLDRPGHGRSGWNTDVLGPHTPHPDYETLYQRFVDPKTLGLWAQAESHDQWPDHEPLAGDRFMASQGVMATTLTAAQQHVEAIAPKLFEVTGDTILVSHSAGGPCGWALAAIGGHRVKAVAAVEPLGYPGLEHSFGVFDNGLCAAELSGSHDPFDRPICFVTGQATWMREANSKAVSYLKDLNYDVTHFLLEEHRILGNNHMLMSEKNSSDIARLLVSWFEGSVMTAQ